MAAATGQSPKKITLGLQGGGSHGAYTWGVLDRLLEDPRIEIEGISGTSAGAMNATMVAEGLMADGREAARAALARFWGRIAEIGRFGPFVRTPLDMMANEWNLDMTPGYLVFDAVSRYLSPYQFNPFNFNPLEEILQHQVDFERVRGCTDVKLFIAATNVHTGKIRVFENHELCPKAVMASAALPHVYQAVEIDGEAYWDGGYMGNPAIFPLIYNCESRDVLLVQINPVERVETPTTMPDIVDRLNEITFNSTLMREMRAIHFVTKLLERHEIDPRHYKRMLLHRIDVPGEMKALTVSSKYNAEWDFLTHLRDVGRAQAGRWLAENFDALGERGTVDIEADYL